MGYQAEPHYGRNRTTCMHRNRNPCSYFFMVNMASDVDCVCTQWRRRQHMAAIYQLTVLPKHAVLIYSVHLFRTFFRIESIAKSRQVVILVANSSNRRKTQEKLKKANHMCVNFIDQQMARITQNHHTFKDFLQVLTGFWKKANCISWALSTTKNLIKQGSVLKLWENNLK